jgi:hypothetical protein
MDRKGTSRTGQDRNLTSERVGRYGVLAVIQAYQVVETHGGRACPLHIRTKTRDRLADDLPLSLPPGGARLQLGQRLDLFTIVALCGGAAGLTLCDVSAAPPII